MKIDRQDVLAFLIGSSILSGLISFLYIGHGMHRKPRQNIRYEWIMGGVLIILGLTNILSQRLKRKTRWSPILAGVLTGLILSFTGRFVYDFPVTVFDFTRSNENMVHVYAMILYSLIHYFVIDPMTMYFM